MSLIVNNDKHMLKVLADTGASSCIILEAYASATFIKTNESNTITWNTMVGKFTTTKTEICL
jgi:predicted aspartyl protease